MQLVNRAFDLMVKIGAILAAVAALNLLGAGPHLVTSARCQLAIDEGAFAASYQQSVNRPPPHSLVKLIASFDRSPRDTLVVPAGVDLGQLVLPANRTSFSVALETGRPRVRKPTCAWIKVTSEETLGLVELPRPIGRPGSLIERDRARALLGPSLARLLVRAQEAGRLTFVSDREVRFSAPGPPVDATLRQAVADATRLTADVRVENRGHGGATSVRVDAPPPYQPQGDQPGFDLAPNESRTVRFVVPSASLAATAAAPQFQAFGDKQRSVNSSVLLGLGAGLGLVALLAFANDVKDARRKEFANPPADQA
jgi:hypothetical protein